ncbi:LuxR C-terminal-related transcriptional regulator [Hymenobacter edaphi]|uniref:LuxR family transcriptional regulator n=1 Tax=Hymenobacter edaphi TaxID=2211146 RepID=A0A328B7S9_9BACT|nr:LuxR C-terminal-related transcriptional regulator [Hymenobacter edaphi]RAK62967.1 LuxR family transcriptional regulator [Hymenobacter edaphi]
MTTEQQRMQDCIAAIASTADFHPGILIVHHIPSTTVAYMSRRGLQLLGITAEELQALGADYHQRFFNPEDAAEYAPKLWALVAQNDFEQVISFFQQVRTLESPDWSLYLSAARLLLRGDDGLPLLLLSNSCAIDPSSHIPLKVQRLVDENNFLRQHAATFASLTGREREVLRLLALGHSAPEIAKVLFISAQTAETHRRNIRQKLGAESAFELGQFARAFDLI